jgi:tetratricopeptide (TPR) repeat protein
VSDYGFAAFNPNAIFTAAPVPATAPESDDHPTLTVHDRMPATGDHPLHDAPSDQARDVQPYFTMAYLEGARTLDQALYRYPLPIQIGLITQMLQALAYLHRHGILHRDLKPANVLVTLDEAGDPRVHLVDFGLAEGRGISGSVSGTLLYLAPEVFESQPLSEATDLYAVGVMLYEIFAGKHPFADSARLIYDVRFSKPEMTPLRQHPELRNAPYIVDIIKRLLAKDPLDRYSDAAVLADELRAAAGLPPSQESMAIRESYLQAAKFVGRSAELVTLTTALANAGMGKGSVWLIGGESGVGKSRLLDELRIQALVTGVVVARGQAVVGTDNGTGGVSYQLWREIGRRLALAFAPADSYTADDLRDLGVLRALVPDIETLLGMSIPLLSPLSDAVAQHFRLASALASGLRRIGQPVLLILEDIQWTGESLAVLRALIPAIARLPVLIVASYRDDERPEIPSQLPGARLLRLTRLNENAISELSVAMLGEVGASAAVVDLLQRETEGNAFFVVETVRALAEEAGSLSEIGRGHLPSRVFAGGVATVIRRRLDRAPETARWLLKLAAIAGRRLDTAILGRAAAMNGQPMDRVAWDRLLTMCAEAAVLEYNDGGWRFAHDKLRETLVESLPDEERRALHRLVAVSIETVYPDDPDRAAALAVHWGAAGDTDKERHYALRAGEQAYALGQFHDSTQFYARALAISAPDSKDELNSTYQLSRARRYLNDPVSVHHYLERAKLLADRIGDMDWIIKVQTEQVYNDQLEGRYDDAGNVLRRYLPDLAQGIDPATRYRFMARYALQLGYERRFDEAIIEMNKTIDLARANGNDEDVMMIMNNLGSLHYYRGDIDEVMRISDMVIAYCRQVNDRHYLSDALGNRGVLLWSLGRYAEAVDILLEALHYDEESGKINSEVGELITLGYCYVGLGDDDLAMVYLRSALRKAVEGELIPLALDALAGIASIWAKGGEHERAAEIYGLALAHSASDVDIEATVKPLIEDVRARLGDAGLQAALERGKLLSLETIIGEVLGY